MSATVDEERVEALERENDRLRRAVSDLMLEKVQLQEAASGLTVG